MPFVETEDLGAYIAHIVAALAVESDENLILGPLSIASDSLNTFIRDQQSPIFVVNRLLQNDDTSEKPSVCYTAINEMYYNKDQSLAAVFVKKGPVIVADKPLCEQLSVTL